VLRSMKNLSVGRLLLATVLGSWLLDCRVLVDRILIISEPFAKHKTRAKQVYLKVVL